MKQLLHGSQYSDISFVIEETAVNAHRCVLEARAPCLLAATEEVSLSGGELNRSRMTFVCEIFLSRAFN